MQLRLQERLRVRRYLLVQLYLGWWVAAALTYAAELMLVPERLVDGPATRALYDVLAPPWWGLAFVLIGGMCAVGCARPLAAWRFAILGLGLGQIAWALGLGVPVLQHWREPDYHGNLLAPTAWVVLAVTTVIIGVWTNREEQQPSNGRG